METTLRLEKWSQSLHCDHSKDGSRLLALLNVSRLLTLTSRRMQYLCEREFAGIRQAGGVLTSRGYTGVRMQYP